jgi:hypothetical protein
VPANYLLVMQTDLRKGTKALRVNLEGRVERPLAKLVMEPLNGFVRQEQNVSYRQLMYMRELIKELEEMSLAMQGKELVELLVYWNFNSTELMQHIVGGMLDAMDALAGQSEKIERLAQYQKEFNQMQVKPGVVLRPGSASLKDQLCLWIGEEMDFVQQRSRLVPMAQGLMDGRQFIEEKKLHFSVSVSVLTLFLRTCQDSGFVLNKKVEPMLRVVSQFTRTAEQEEISYKSMRNSWHEVEKGHKEKLKGILMEMYKRAHRY